MPFPWRAGMRVTAERLNAHAPIFVFKDGHEQRTNSDTPLPDADLTLELDEGVWEVTAVLDFLGTSESEGIRVAWETDMPRLSIRRTAGPDADHADRRSTRMTHASHAPDTHAHYGNHQGGQLRSHAWESFVVQGPGSLTLLWSQLTASSEMARLASSSYLKAQRIG
ncbi:hypothetical protein RIF23_05180 [Lipingzhangella sp. LS1_29]|uniref:Uncharacterized protein n=1 Tax=Lipingzhangella rawalii TaxID=2055835 RepID=A0ABU2H2Z9_9ACTN|nr:hypothetical protein [Lipingzhangella rawalii]MDS1269682.1 hypothetical protein [Lipingzhangella rawalii]